MLASEACLQQPLQVVNFLESDDMSSLDIVEAAIGQFMNPINSFSHGDLSASDQSHEDQRNR